MGISLELFRARIGVFKDPGSKLRHNASEYTPFCRSTDVHWRTMFCSIFAISLMMCIYRLFLSKKLLTDRFSTGYMTEFGYFQLHNAVLHQPIDLYAFGHMIYGSYHHRILLLAADIELNPGPGPETDLILKAIEVANDKTNAQLLELRNDIGSLKKDLSAVQSDLGTIKSQVKDMGDRQAVIENEVRSIKTKVDDIEFSAGVMEADIAGLSLNDERKNDTINSMLNHINNMDREMRKNNLRIFGVADIPDESTDETKAKVISDVLNKAFNIDGFESDKGDEHNGIPEEARLDSMACLDYAKRLGKYVIISH